MSERTRKRKVRARVCQIEWADRTRSPHLDAIRANIDQCLVHLPRNALESVSVAVVGDRVMARLHHQFMGIDQSTDVLTFELANDDKGRVTQGEVVVCSKVARLSARRLHRKPEHELTLYVLHGLLHLCGMDDQDNRSYDQMHAEEDRILRAVGIGNVFSRQG